MSMMHVRASTAALLLFPKLFEQRARRVVANMLANVWTFFTKHPIDRNSSLFKDVFEVAASRLRFSH
jgi:hypothetical protein